MNDPHLPKKPEAVALTYEQGKDEAPRVTAKGTGELAKKIIQEAKASQIPIQQDESLISLLSELEVNEMIPTELYEAVAEIFAFIYTIDEQAQESET